jgi:hypothetical protein
MPEESRNSLNANHERRLSVTCRYIDKLRADRENILRVSSSRPAFPSTFPISTLPRDAWLKTSSAALYIYRTSFSISFNCFIISSLCWWTRRESSYLVPSGICNLLRDTPLYRTHPGSDGPPRAGMSPGTVSVSVPDQRRL